MSFSGCVYCRWASSDAIRVDPPEVHFVPWHVPVLVVVSQDQFSQSLSSTSSASRSSPSPSQASVVGHGVVQSSIQDHIRAATELANSKFGAFAHNPNPRRGFLRQRSADYVQSMSKNVGCGVSRRGGSNTRARVASSSQHSQVVSPLMFSTPTTPMSHSNDQSSAREGVVQRQDRARGLSNAGPVDTDSQAHMLSPDRPEDLAAIHPPPLSPACGDRDMRCESGLYSFLNPHDLEFLNIFSFNQPGIIYLLGEKFACFERFAFCFWKINFAF